jgi:hypothetical protein
MNLQSLQTIDYGRPANANNRSPRNPAGRLWMRPRLVPSPPPRPTKSAPPPDDGPTLSIEEQIARWVDANPPQLYRGGA